MVSDGDTAGVLQCWKEFISVATDGVTARVVKYVKKVTPLYQMVWSGYVIILLKLNEKF